MIRDNTKILYACIELGIGKRETEELAGWTRKPQPKVKPIVLIRAGRLDVYGRIDIARDRCRIVREPE
jgi:hypothetical protein